MRSIDAACLVMTIAAGAHAAPGRYLSVHAGAGTAAILGYESVSQFATPSGPRAGLPLNLVYASRIGAGTSPAFGVAAGGRKGRISGGLEIQWAAAETPEQDVSFEREGSTYDPVNGYEPVASGNLRLPAGWLRLTAVTLSAGFDVAMTGGAIVPYAGLGLGAAVMTASSKTLTGEDGKALSETKAGLAVHMTLGLRLATDGLLFGWIEARPGWHLMSPVTRGVDYTRTRDEFVWQATLLLAGIGWQWE
jgi:opacity protein-like surface antigen